MKKRIRMHTAIVAMLGSVAFPAGLLAGTFSSNFNDGQVPANCQVFGNAVVESTGGVNDSGVLKVTKAINSQAGSFIINDLDAGAAVYGFKITMMARVGGGTPTPADGWSVCIASDLPDGTWGEGGAGTGITVSFDTYNNSGEAPQISIKVGNQTVKATGIIPIADMVTGSQFVPVVISMDADGAFELDFNGKAVFPKFYLPNYQPLAGVRYGFGGRTGGSNENVFIDDLNIETYLKPLPGFALQPQSMTVIAGSPAKFNTQLNNSDGATIQWLRNGAPIAGATDTTYTLQSVTAADNGAIFTMKVTLGTAVVTSAEAVLKVVNVDLPATPVLSFNFNDGAVPAGAFASDSTVINTVGGVGDSGVLMLTDAANDQNGAFVIEDPSAGAPVFGIAARFDLRIGGGTELPADGFSFNFAPDLPDSGLNLQVEEGVGTGLSVTADIYDNGNGEAPSFSVKYGGTVVADKKVLLSEMSTGDGFADVIFRLTADGLMDFAWNGVVIFDRVPVPGYTSISGGRVGLYARTGGANAMHAVDNLKIYTYLTSETVRISKQPAAQTVLAGKTATFSADVNLTDGTTYQWLLNGATIAGATQNSYTTPATVATDNGAKYKVTVKRGTQTVTSDEVVLSVVDLAPPTNPQLSYNFNNGIPAGAEVGGTTFVDTAGGISDSGVLKATIAENSQAGGFRSAVIADGAQLTEINIAVDVLAGGGTTPPADGFSINIGSDLPLIATGDAENGSGTGLTFAFDTYDNGGGEAPSIDIKFKGQVIVSKKVSATLMNVADTYFPVLIRVKENGVVDMAYGDVIIYNGYQIPNYTPPSGNKLAIYARTGGANANFWFDNLRLGAKIPTAVSITTQPADALVLAGQTATFKVQVSNPAGVTYQWMRNGANIAGATQQSYTTPALAAADDGAGYTVKVTAPGNTLTSSAAYARVMASFDAGTTPVVSFDFNDGATPDNTVIIGNAVMEESVLKLTINENSQAGAFFVPTPDGVSPIYDFTATWKMRVGGGSDNPADGFSFVLASDLTDVTFGEDGMGSGLVVSFDIYDNAGGEAPAIDITYKTVPVATVKYDIAKLRTGDAFVPVGVRVNRDGTLDMYYNNMAVYRGLTLPNYTPFEAGRFAWGGRTGGLNENQWMDDVKISVNTQPAVVEKPQFTGIKKNTDGTITITWTGGGTLQVSTTVDGTYSDVTGATSPYTVTPPSPVLFGRIKK